MEWLERERAALAEVLADPAATRPGWREAALRGATAFPGAAIVLLDLLRAGERAALADALIAESLAYAALQGSAEHARWLAVATRAPPGPPGALEIARDGDRLDLTIARPGARNAIDRSLRDALSEAFVLAGLDDAIASVRLRGVGRCFGVGADMSEFGTTRDPVTAHRLRMATLPAVHLLGCAAKLHVHVHGACVGASLEIAAFARYLTAAPDAWFQLPELAMGIIPGAGGTVSLPRRIGRRRTALLVLTGRRIGARTALDWGLVDAIVDDPPADHRRANADVR